MECARFIGALDWTLPRAQTSRWAAKRKAALKRTHSMCWRGLLRRHSPVKSPENIRAVRIRIDQVRAGRNEVRQINPQQKIRRCLHAVLPAGLKIGDIPGEPAIVLRERSRNHRHPTADARGHVQSELAGISRRGIGRGGCEDLTCERAGNAEAEDRNTTQLPIFAPAGRS